MNASHDPSDATPPLWLTSVTMLLVSLVVYLPAALGADLLQFDDNFFFGPDNPEFVRGLGAVWTEPIANAYLPVAHSSLWLDFAVAGDAPGLPHLHALLLHAAAAVVLVRLLLALGVPGAAAHVAAALFVAHPALAESVAWVSSRKYVLSGLFVFASLLQTARFARAPSARRAAAIALLTALAMLSNATAVVAPLLAFGVVMWVGGARRRFAAPLLSLGVAAALAAMHQQIAAAQGTLSAAASGDRLAQVPGAFWHYLVTSVWPTELNVLYPEVATLERFEEQWLAGSLALLAFAALGVGLSLRPRTRAVGAGLCAFVVALLPFNTAYPASAIAAADRYLYLAIPGLVLAVTSASALLHRRGPWFAAALGLPLLWLGASRAHAFRDDATLWQASLAVEESNAVAHLNLVYDRMRTPNVSIERLEPHLRAAVKAARYPVHELRARLLLRQFAMGAADYESAANHARAAIRAARAQLRLETSAPRRALASDQLLQAQLDAFEPLQLCGLDAAAEEALAEARAQAPEHPQVVAFAATRELKALQPELLARAARGDAPRLDRDDARGAAVDDRLAAARERAPDHAGLWLAQALWDQARDRVTSALRCYRKATELRPGDATAWLGAARLMREKRLFGGALDFARKGFERRRDPRLLQEVALALVGLNELVEAEQFLEAYMRLEPDDRDTGKILSNLLIGRAYTLLNDPEQRGKVKKLVEDALRYNPDESKAYVVMGKLAHEQRSYALAVRYLEKAVGLLPGFEDARRELATSRAALGYDCLLRKDFDGAVEAWRSCLEGAPEGFDAGGIADQLQALWGRFEAQGVQRLKDGDLPGAIAAFRRCLDLDPAQHWGAWLLATALHRSPDGDPAEIERLCRQAIAWQQGHGQDAGRQVYLLALTLRKLGRSESARQAARDYLVDASEGSDPAVLKLLLEIAEG
jgi:tetratricopeptide (TPR) repeat protein